ncbi:MAG: uracil-DNA glycosylase [Chitinophagaceae bacterium]|jgi:uracil-DNA glycosylase|nr:uracil-DNA glycosylase [Chitinophagaceae bacterium]
MDVKIEERWKKVLQAEFDKPYFSEIVNHIKIEKAQGKMIYPKGSQIFYAFDSTPFDKVKVVILGQDPYHGAGQAHGLCFSVQHGTKPPPSLVNIFKELNTDLGVPINASGNLSSWAHQGVLLLNAILTVRANEPASHEKIGWMNFTDEVIRILSTQKKNLVFLLWGNFARHKKTLIDVNHHLVLESAHPSPFSVTKFSGCRHFSKANEYLAVHHIDPINWHL